MTNGEGDYDHDKNKWFGRIEAMFILGVVVAIFVFWLMWSWSDIF